MNEDDGMGKPAASVRGGVGDDTRVVPNDGSVAGGDNAGNADADPGANVELDATNAVSRGGSDGNEAGAASGVGNETVPAAASIANETNPVSLGASGGNEAGAAAGVGNDMVPTAASDPQGVATEAANLVDVSGMFMYKRFVNELEPSNPCVREVRGKQEKAICSCCHHNWTAFRAEAAKYPRGKLPADSLFYGYLKTTEPFVKKMTTAALTIHQLVTFELVYYHAMCFDPFFSKKFDAEDDVELPNEDQLTKPKGTKGKQTAFAHSRYVIKGQATYRTKEKEDFEKNLMPWCDFGLGFGMHIVFDDYESSNYKNFQVRVLNNNHAPGARSKELARWYALYRDKFMRNHVVLAMVMKLEEWNTKLGKELTYPYKFADSKHYMSRTTVLEAYDKMEIAKSVPINEYSMKNHFEGIKPGTERDETYMNRPTVAAAAASALGKRTSDGGVKAAKVSPKPTKVPPIVSMRLIFNPFDFAAGAVRWKGAYLASHKPTYPDVPQVCRSQTNLPPNFTAEQRKNVVIDLQGKTSFKVEGEGGVHNVAHFESGLVGAAPKESLVLLLTKYRELIETVPTEGQEFCNGNNFVCAMGVPSMLSVHCHDDQVDGNAATTMLQGRISDDDAAVLDGLRNSITNCVKKAHKLYLGHEYVDDAYNVYTSFQFVQTRINPHEVRVEMPHLDFGPADIATWMDQGVYVYLVIVPLTQGGNWEQIWLDDTKDEVGASDARGRMVFVTYGSFLVLPMTALHGGNFACTYDGSTHCRFHVTVTPNNVQKPNLRNHQPWYLYGPPDDLVAIALSAPGAAMNAMPHPNEWCRLLLKKSIPNEGRNTKKKNRRGQVLEAESIVVRNPQDHFSHVRSNLLNYISKNLILC